MERMIRTCLWTFPAVYVGGVSDVNFVNPYAAFEMDLKVRDEGLVKGFHYLVSAQSDVPGIMSGAHWHPEYQQDFDPRDEFQYHPEAKVFSHLPRHRFNLHGANLVGVKKIESSTGLYQALIESLSTFKSRSLWRRDTRSYEIRNLGCLSFVESRYSNAQIKASA